MTAVTEPDAAAGGGVGSVAAMTCSERAARRFPFVAYLSEASRGRIDREARLMGTGKGGRLLSRGDEAAGVYLVLSGRLDVYNITAGGRETTLYRVLPGQSCLFALSSVFAGVAYPAWVRATAPTGILVIPPGLARSLHDAEPAFRAWAFTVQSRRVLDLVTAIEAVQTLPVGERLVSYLLRAADASLQVRETHEEIAAYLGTAREVVSRHLAGLARDGVITRSRGVVTIADPEGLRRAAGGAA